MGRILDVHFERFKYGRELCVDARRVETWQASGPFGVPHRLDFHEVLIVERGMGTLHLDSERLSLTAPAVVMTSPRQVRRIVLDQPLDVHLVVFTPDAFDGFARLAAPQLTRQAAVTCPPLPAMARLTEVAEYMWREIQMRPSYLPQMLDSLLTQFMILLCGDGTPANGPLDNSGLMARLNALIEGHFREHHQVSFYAESLCVSPDHLSAVARCYSGTSVGMLIRKRLHLEASRLLLHTDWDVSQIGFHLGYDDPAHFTRSFRRNTGISPTSLRRKVAEKYR